MTTIAFDGTTIAADGMICADNTICTTKAKKIFMLDDSVNISWAKGKPICLAGAGIVPEIHRLLNKIEHPEIDEADCECALITDTHIYLYGGSVTWHPWDYDMFALGSGRDFALSAMRMGKSAVEAVKHAASMSLGTGGKIQSIKVR